MSEFSDKQKDDFLSTPITVNTQYIKDVSFENPHPLKNIGKKQFDPDIAVDIDVQAQGAGEKEFEVTLTVKAKAEHKNNVVFLIELQYAGIFTLSEEIPKDAVHPVLLIECPRLLFPFARSILSNITREGGYPPLLLNPIDFAGMYRQQLDAQSAQVSTAKH